MYSEGWMNARQQPKQVRARFECEPPADLRKSNFFSFRVELRAASGATLEVVCAKFLHFLNEDIPQDGLLQLRNGIKYAITLKYPNDVTEHRELYLTLVDAHTQEPIRYEGHDDNPKMQRVLLTHEAICTRCSLNKSCGNKNEAPSDPVIAPRGILKFFLKCNQNCLKGAGNPRDTRRFALSVSLDGQVGGPAALSSPIFVHNNSKHSRNKRKREQSGAAARISHLLGPTPEGKVVLVGENLRDSDRLFVDNEAVIHLAHRSESVKEAWLSPLSSGAPTCRVILQSGENFLEAGTLTNLSGPLAYVSPSPGSFDFISPRWTLPGVSFACGNLQLPILALIPGQTAKVSLPPSIHPGVVTICVFWNGRPQFTFPYRVMDKSEFERLTLEPDAGYTCLYRRGNFPPFGVLESNPRNAAVFVDEVDVKPVHWEYSDPGYYDSCRSYSSSSSDAPLHSSPAL